MSDREIDAATITLAEAEEIARAEHSVMLQYPDGWEMMVWYAPGAPATNLNDGVGFLWRQSRTSVNKHGKPFSRIVKASNRGTYGDLRGYVSREEARRFHDEALRVKP